MGKQELKLSAYSQFHCLAEKCPLCCCQGHEIEVDPQTLRKWQDLADSEDSTNLLAKIVHVESNHVNMLRRDDGTCACLDPEKLCTVQAQHGHDLLPQICRDFPRDVVETDGKRLETLVLSCPEVVRLTLFNNTDSPLFDHSGNHAHETNREYGPASTSQRLDLFVDEVMRNTKYPLNVKILAISTTLAQLAKLMAQVNFNQNVHDDLFKKVGSRLYDLNLAIKRGKIKPAPVTRGSYWKSIYLWASMKQISLTSFDLNDSAWHKLISNCQDTEDDFIKIDNEFSAYINSAKSTLHEYYEKLFLRYLTITFCNHGFPWSSTSTFHHEIAAFIHCITKLSVIQLICLIKQYETGSLDEECLHEVIYRVERKFDHSGFVYEVIKKDPVRRNLRLYQECFIDIF